MKALRDPDCVLSEGLAAIRAQFKVPAAFPPAVDLAALLDEDARGVVTVEEATVQGGLGSAVAELLAQQQPVRMRILGVTGFAPTANAADLLEHFGHTADGIARGALELAGA